LKLIEKSKYVIFTSLADHYKRYGDDKNNEKYKKLAYLNNGGGPKPPPPVPGSFAEFTL
jgi:hypothetical protein